MEHRVLRAPNLEIAKSFSAIETQSAPFFPSSPPLNNSKPVSLFTTYKRAATSLISRHIRAEAPYQIVSKSTLIYALAELVPSRTKRAHTSLVRQCNQTKMLLAPVSKLPSSYEPAKHGSPQKSTRITFFWGFPVAEVNPTFNPCQKCPDVQSQIFQCNLHVFFPSTSLQSNIRFLPASLSSFPVP